MLIARFISACLHRVARLNCNVSRALLAVCLFVSCSSAAADFEDVVSAIEDLNFNMVDWLEYVDDRQHQDLYNLDLKVNLIRSIVASIDIAIRELTSDFSEFRTTDYPAMKTLVEEINSKLDLLQEYLGNINIYVVRIANSVGEIQTAAMNIQSQLTQIQTEFNTFLLAWAPYSSSVIGHLDAILEKLSTEISVNVGGYVKVDWDGLFDVLSSWRPVITVDFPGLEHIEMTLDDLYGLVYPFYDSFSKVRSHYPYQPSVVLWGNLNVGDDTYLVPDDTTTVALSTDTTDYFSAILSVVNQHRDIDASAQKSLLLIYQFLTSNQVDTAFQDDYEENLKRTFEESAEVESSGNSYIQQAFQFQYAPSFSDKSGLSSVSPYVPSEMVFNMGSFLGKPFVFNVDTSQLTSFFNCCRLCSRWLYYLLSLFLLIYLTLLFHKFLGKVLDWIFKATAL